MFSARLRDPENIAWSEAGALLHRPIVGRSCIMALVLERSEPYAGVGAAADPLRVETPGDVVHIARIEL